MPMLESVKLLLPHTLEISLRYHDRYVSSNFSSNRNARCACLKKYLKPGDPTKMKAFYRPEHKTTALTSDVVVSDFNYKQSKETSS